MIVYQAYNPSADAFYIGKTVKGLEHRRRQHFTDARLARNNSVFHKAIRKYGEGAFEWCVLHEDDCLEGINAAERHWIALVKATGHRLYNLRDGGDGGSVAGPANHNYGKTLPEEVKRKISESVRKHYQGRPGTMTGVGGEAAPFFGKSHTAETCAKISSSKKGKPNPALLGAANPSARAVYCVTTGEAFVTASDAANAYQLDLSSIIKCCRGKVKSVKGKCFEYAAPGVFGWSVIE